jgi:hypothetical protein
MPYELIKRGDSRHREKEQTNKYNILDSVYLQYTINRESQQKSDKSKVYFM